MPSCFLFKILAIGWMGRFGSRLKSLFHGHTHGRFITAHPVNAKLGKSPFKEPGRCFIFFGSQVGTWKWEYVVRRSTAPLCCGKSLMVTAVLRDVVPSAKPVGNVLAWYHPELYPVVHRTLSREEFQPSKFNLK